MGDMKFHEKLAMLLENTPGMSQEKMAIVLGLTQQSVSNLAQGKQRPYADQVFLISRALGVSTDYLLDESRESADTIPVGRKLTEEESALLGVYKGSQIPIEVVSRLVANWVRQQPKSEDRRSQG